MVDKKKGKDRESAFVLWFNEISNKDVAFVGGKNASLGEMYVELSSKGVSVPYGFAVTAYAYRYLIKEAGIQDEIRKILGKTDVKDMKSLNSAGHKIRQLIPLTYYSILPHNQKQGNCPAFV